MPDETRTNAPSGTEARPPQAPQFSLDASTLATVYTNFCHVNITPEDLILDFGLNTQMNPSPQQPIKLTHRLVMNFFTAKRLLHALHFAVSKYESLYGPLELDFHKRARVQPPAPPRPAADGFQP